MQITKICANPVMSTSNHQKNKNQPSFGLLEKEVEVFINSNFSEISQQAKKIGINNVETLFKKMKECQGVEFVFKEYFKTSGPRAKVGLYAFRHGEIAADFGDAGILETLTVDKFCSLLPQVKKYIKNESVVSQPQDKIFMGIKKLVAWREIKLKEALNESMQESPQYMSEADKKFLRKIRADKVADCRVELDNSLNEEKKYSSKMNDYFYTTWIAPTT